MRCVLLFSSPVLALAMTVPAAAQVFVGGWGSSAYQYSMPRTDTAMSGCGLSMTASDDTLTPGQSAQINLWAHFPATGYAFASAELDIGATLPGWSAASDGVIAGGNVNNIVASQLHQPFAGIFADPSNPLRIWSGVYKPISYAPQFVTITAIPGDYSYYPSELTSSSVPCEAAPVSLSLFVNPLSVGGAEVAPAAGTEIELQSRDAFDAKNEQGPVLVAMREAGLKKLRIQPELPPDRLTMQAELIETSAVVDTFSVNYAAIKFEFKPQNSTYEMHNHWSAADSFEYRFIRGAQVDYFLKLQGIDGDVTDVVGLPGLPDTFAHNVQLDPVKDETRVVSRVAFDQPVRVIAPDGREIIVDAIEVSTIQNNLRQMTIGLHTVHVERSHGAGGGGGAGKVHFSDLSAAW